MNNNRFPGIDLDFPCIPSNYSRLMGRELGLQVRDLPGFLSNGTEVDGVSPCPALSLEAFLDEDTLLTPRQQLQLLANALALSDDELFGLRLGKRFTSPTHGAMGFLAMSSPNLMLVLQAFQLYLPTRMNVAQLSLQERQDWLDVECQFHPLVSGDLLRAMSEICTVIFADCAEFIVGKPLHDMHIDFVHPAPAYADRYPECLPGSFRFSQPQIRLTLEKSTAEIPNASANHQNYQLALEQCDNMLAALKSNKNSMTYQLQKMLLSGPPGTLSEEDAASALFITKRTLARRLKQEGTHFRAIRDEILSRQAADYLGNSALSVDAIANMLNYHDSSNFRRAFKRWFGQTPDQYRQRC